MKDYYKDKEWLYEQYIVHRKTISKIAEETSKSASCIRKNLCINDIKIRNNRECQLGRKILWKDKISKTRKKLFSQGKIKPTFLGKKHSEESKKKISLSRIGRKFPKLSAIKKIQNSGSGNPNYGKRGKDASGYKGDKCISPLRSQIRCSRKYKEWRTSIFERDNYTCQHCNSRGGDKHAHHIKEFSTILNENNIKSFNDAMKLKELWDMSNGITLCENCHKKTFIYQGNQYDRRK